MKERFCIDFNLDRFADSYKDKFALYKEAGFNRISLAGSGYKGFMPTERIIQFVKDANEAGLKVDNYHPYFADNKYLWYNCPERQGVIDNHLEAIKACGEAGIDSIVIHPTSGPNNLLVSGLGLDAFEQFVEAGEKYNVVICIENLRTHVFHEFLFKNIHSPYLGTCHDTGHEFAYNKGMEFPRKYGPLTFTHIHDNDGFGDLHHLPGDNDLNFKAVARMYKEIGYEGPLHLEAGVKEENYNGMDMLSYLKEAYQRLINVFGE